jgi:hypothetical protein
LRVCRLNPNRRMWRIIIISADCQRISLYHTNKCNK